MPDENTIYFPKKNNVCNWKNHSSDVKVEMTIGLHSFYIECQH